MKKLFMRILGLLVTLIVMLNIEESFAGVDQEKINECIKEYYKAEEDEIKITSFKNLGNKRFGVFVDEYDLINSVEYYKTDERLFVDSGELNPVKFKVISLFGNYKIIFSNKPSEGELNRSSLEKIFPKDVLDDLDNNYEKYLDELKDSNKEKLEEEMSLH